MFIPLHALAKTATLMIVITAEGDQLRVNVMPTQVGDKMKPHTLKPLSLLATPDELNEGFIAALETWREPKRSLVDQARDAAGDDATESGAKAKERKSTPAPAPAAKGKPGRPPKASKGAAGDATPGAAAADDDAGAGPAAAGADDDAAAGPAAAGADDDAAAGPAAGADDPSSAGDTDPAADVFTLDLF